MCPLEPSEIFLLFSTTLSFWMISQALAGTPSTVVCPLRRCGETLSCLMCEDQGCDESSSDGSSLFIVPVHRFTPVISATVNKRFQLRMEGGVTLRMFEECSWNVCRMLEDCEDRRKVWRDTRGGVFITVTRMLEILSALSRSLALSLSLSLSVM